MNLSQIIQDKINEVQNPSCLGIDPHKDLIPKFLLDKYRNDSQNEHEMFAKAAEEYFINILNGVKTIIGIVKLQLAFFEQFGSYGMKAYENILKECSKLGMIIISDSKRGDIGSTSAAYAEAFLSKDSLWESDCVTVNPYLGSDGIIPFVKLAKQNNKGVFVLLKTSNPSSSEIQDLIVDDEPLYIKVAEYIKEWDSCDCGSLGFVAAVVGATHPDLARKIRESIPNTWLLVPGYGAQGAKGEDLKHFLGKDSPYVIVPASRSLGFAYKNSEHSEENYVQASVDEALKMKEDLTCLLR